MRKSTLLLVFYLLFVSLSSIPCWACTCFCMNTPTGPVYGANLDLFIPADGLIFINQRGIAKEWNQPGTTGKIAKWESKYGSVSFTLAGKEFAFGGMNEAGIVVGSMELLASEFPQKDERPGMVIGLWAQYVLDTCATLEEVMKVDSVIRIEDDAPPVHFLIADAEGNCVAVEWMDGKLVCYSSDNIPVKAMSNMPYDRALAAFKRGGARWWWSNPGQSAERFAAAHNRCVTYDAEKEPDAITYAFGTLVNSVSAPHTKWSIVYDIGKREIWYGTVRSRGPRHISFDQLDFSCGGPVLMLDVNTAEEGDVNTSFVPYDHDTNLKILKTLCDRYELGVSDQVALDVTNQVESYECAK